VIDAKSGMTRRRQGPPREGMLFSEVSEGFSTPMGWATIGNMAELDPGIQARRPGPRSGGVTFTPHLVAHETGASSRRSMCGGSGGQGVRRIFMRYFKSTTRTSRSCHVLPFGTTPQNPPTLRGSKPGLHRGRQGPASRAAAIICAALDNLVEGPASGQAVQKHEPHVGISRSHGARNRWRCFRGNATRPYGFQPEVKRSVARSGLRQGPAYPAGSPYSGSSRSSRPAEPRGSWARESFVKLVDDFRLGTRKASSPPRGLLAGFPAPIEPVLQMYLDAHLVPELGAERR